MTSGSAAGTGAEGRAAEAVEAVGLSGGVEEEVPAMAAARDGRVVSAAATGAELAAYAGGAADAAMGAREGDVDVGAETRGLLGESP